MNIILMHTHDSGRCLEPYGYGIHTPNLMALAKESTLFRHCYCAGPTCSPSRAALMTGTWPHVNGMLGLAHRGFAIHDYSKHLAQYLNSFNYETVLCGVQHEAAASEVIGYCNILKDPKERSMNAVEKDLQHARLASDYLRSRAGKEGNFFLSFGLHNTHREYPAPEVEQDYVLPPATAYDCKGNREDMAGYITSAKAADQCIGMISDAVKDAGLEGDSVIVFTTDHGIAFPYNKCNLYDTGIGVAMMIRYPGNPTMGTAVDTLVSHIDLFPTLCDLCGLKKPEWLQGQTLRGVLAGDTQEVNEQIFSEVTYHASYEPMRCIRTQRYKLIRRFDYHLGMVPSNIDDGNCKKHLLESGVMDRPVAREMLFDLYLDPMERENLVGDPGYRNLYNDLSLRLFNWMEQTNDPLVTVSHRVPKPEGARVNKLSCLQPSGNDFE